MIITRLKGGLGNQLFQYVAGFRVASKYNEQLKLDVTGYENPKHMNSDTPRKYRLHAFNLSFGVATSDEAMKARNPLGLFSKVLRAFNQKILKKNYIDYHPEFFKKKHSYIEGYFQSEKNFEGIEDKISKEFQLKKEFESESFLFEKNKIDKNKSVSVHVRRGDYANDKTTNNYFGTCSLEYYKQAMDYMESKVQNPVYYFFSDDIEWVKKKFGLQDNYIFVSNPKLEDYEELILMSICSHNIIANSSFSWWGAWLNNNPNKIVIAPKKWVNVEPNPNPNIIPEGWVTI